MQDRDSATEERESLIPVTKRVATEKEIEDMIFANKIVKHSKSNAIVLAKNSVLISSGIGQTSRVDALKQAITKAHNFGFSLEGAVMASDAFFPFPDSVEEAAKFGIAAIIQPGGSMRDAEVIAKANELKIPMVFTGVRGFKH